MLVSPVLFYAAFDYASYQVWTCTGWDSPFHHIRVFEAQGQPHHRSNPAVSFLRHCHASKHTGLPRSPMFHPNHEGLGGSGDFPQ